MLIRLTTWSPIMLGFVDHVRFFFGRKWPTGFLRLGRCIGILDPCFGLWLSDLPGEAQ
jgi:hypothetical protein